MIKKIILILFCALFFLNYFPVKFAITNEKIPADSYYILVKSQRVTGFDWMIIGDQTGQFATPRDIMLQGEKPERYFFDSTGNTAENTFLCYGEHLSENVFLVKQWEVLYPIKRNCIRPFFLQSPWYFSIMDFLD